MPPGVRYTKDRIVAEAFSLVEEKGIHQLSARGVAKRLGMSLAPIYSSIGSMDELSKEVIKKGKSMLLSYTREQYTDRVFLNMGTGVVLFARDHPNIYKAIFVEGDEYKYVVDELMSELAAQMATDPRFADMPEADRKALLSKMWILTHGLASLVFAKLVKKTSQKDIIATLVDIGGVIIADAMSKSGKR